MGLAKLIALFMVLLLVGSSFIGLIFYFIIGDGQYNTTDHPASQFIFREWFVNLESSFLFLV